MQKLYRAVKKASFNPDELHTVKATRRLPGNVPYLLDNIWEFLRPEGMPSRRHVAYASPSPEIALASASARRKNPEDYVVCEIEVVGGEVKVAHIKEEDAKEHHDIDNVRTAVMQAIGADFSDLPLHEKLHYAPLFLPGVSKAELQEAFAANPRLQALEPIIRTSTFWDDAVSTPQPHNGELFFEMLNGGGYRLKEVSEGLHSEQSKKI
jgi:hypothetical protein